MGIKELAVQAAQEQQRHNAEVERLRREQLRETFMREAEAWLISEFTKPDEFLCDLNQVQPIGHVRLEDLWFTIQRTRVEQYHSPPSPFRLNPSEQCPCEPDNWHRVDASIHGISSGFGIYDLSGLGAYLSRTENGTRGPSTGRCRICDATFGAAEDARGSRWVGVVTQIGDLPRMYNEWEAQQ